MPSSLFINVDKNNKRVPYFRPQKTHFLQKCINKLLQNSKTLGARKTFYTRSLSAMNNQKEKKSFCPLEITIQNTDKNEVHDAKKGVKRKRKMIFSKKVLDSVPFPEDLDEFFKYGPAENQVVPETDVPLTFRKPDFPRTPQVHPNSKIEEIKTKSIFPTPYPLKTLRKAHLLRKPQKHQSKMGGKDTEHIKSKVPTSYPETPKRNLSRFCNSGPEFQVVRPQIVPETPSQIPLDDGNNKRVFLVPETPLVDVFKTPRAVEI